jgi:zinc transporter 2
MATVLIIWVLLGVLLYEAVERILHIESVSIDGLIMLVTSLIGILFNVINLLILNCCCNGPKQEKVEGEEVKVKKEDTNIRAAIIHLAGDLI